MQGLKILALCSCPRVGKALSENPSQLTSPAGLTQAIIGGRSVLRLGPNRRKRSSGRRACQVVDLVLMMGCHAWQYSPVHFIPRNENGIRGLCLDRKLLFSYFGNTRLFPSDSNEVQNKA